MYLVIGATAYFGRQTVETLHAEGRPVRALTRTPDKAALPEGVEVVQADLTAPETLPAALDGVSAVFLVLRYGMDATALIEAAAKAGVRRVVFLSSGAVVDGADEQPDVIAAYHAGVERLIAESGMEHTFLRLMFPAINSLTFGMQLRGGDVVRVPYARASVSAIHERDVADVAVRAMADQGHAGEVYDLTGPQALTQTDQVAILARTLAPGRRPRQARDHGRRSAMKRELDAADLLDPRLRAAYAACARYLRRRNSAAYPAARALLPAGHRPYWDATLAFTTYVDDLLDDPSVEVQERTARYDRYVDRFHGLAAGEDPWPDGGGRGAHLARAFAHFSATWQIPQASVRLFLDTIRTDLSVTRYETFDDLAGYIRGVCVQGSQWGGLLFHPRDEEAAAAAAEAMSFGLQLADYLFDLREDLRDGRLYLPLEDLARFGLARAEVERAVMVGRMTPPLRELVEFEVRRAREYLDEAAGWWRLVHPSMRELPRQYVALARASTDQIVRDDYDILRPSRHRRTAAALHAAVTLKAAWARGRATRLLHPPPPPGRALGPAAQAAAERRGES